VVLLGIRARLLGFGLWALGNFGHAVRTSWPSRLAEELLVFGLLCPVLIDSRSCTSCCTR